MAADDDIEELKKRIAQLENQLRYYTKTAPLLPDAARRALSKLPVTVYAVDVDGAILFVQGRDFLSGADNPQATLYEQLPGWQTNHQYIRQALRGETHTNIILTHEAQTYIAQYAPLYDDSNNAVTGAICVLQQINNDAALLPLVNQEGRLLQQLFDYLQHYVTLIEPDGTIADISESALELLQLERADLIGKSVSEIDVPVANDQLEQIQQAIERSAAGDVVTFDLQLHMPQEIHLAVTMRPLYLYDGASLPYLLLVEGTNISEQIDAQQSIEKSLQRERELSDLKTRFITTTSHEFRTPLAIIASSAYLLEQYYDRLAPEKRQQNFGKIQTNVHHMANMLDDILLLGQLRSNTWDQEITTVNLHRVLNEVVQSFTTTQANRHKISFSSFADTAMITGDEQLLRYMITHVLRNAILYSELGQEITVTLRQSGGSLMLRIRDNGGGIDVEDAPYLFDAFYRGQAVSNVPGHGLGLTIARDVARLHGGDIKLVETSSTGSIFEVVLPYGGDAPGVKQVGH